MNEPKIEMYGGKNILDGEDHWSRLLAPDENKENPQENQTKDDRAQRSKSRPARRDDYEI